MQNDLLTTKKIEMPEMLFSKFTFDFCFVILHFNI
jgi:hypothetical protein